MRHGPPATSPILAKIVLDNKIDGHALCDIPEDIFSEMLEDRQLAEDMRATVHDLRARAGTNVSPTSRVPRAQDIAQSLASLSASPAPSLSASPEITEEREQPPSPHTPPPWDWSDDEEVHQYLGFSGAHTYMPFGSPSTAPHLLQPVITLSPGASCELSALMMPDAQDAADFASVDAHEVSEHEAEGEAETEGGADAVGSGDHPSLPQDQGDLPSRQDPEVNADTQEQQAELSSAAAGTETPQPAPQRPRLRLNSSLTSLPLRPGSCPPLLPLTTYIPPRTPPVPAAPAIPPVVPKTFVEEAVQACVEVPERVYASVAVQTRALAETAVQTEVESKREDSQVRPSSADHSHAEPPLVAESCVLANETQGGSASTGEPADRALSSASAESAKPVTKTTGEHETPAKETAAQANVSNPEETVTGDPEPLSKSQLKKRARAAAALADQSSPQDNDGTSAQAIEQTEVKQSPENGASASEGEPQEKKDQMNADDKQAPLVPPKSDAALAKPAGGSASQEQSAPKPPDKDPKVRMLARRAQSTLGGSGDNSWSMGATPPSLPAMAEVRRSVSGQGEEAGSGGKRKLKMVNTAEVTGLKKQDKEGVKGSERAAQGGRSREGGTEDGGTDKRDSQVRANGETAGYGQNASTAPQKAQAVPNPIASCNDVDAQDKAAPDAPSQQDGQEVEDPVAKAWELDPELADQSVIPHNPETLDADGGQKASEGITSESKGLEHQREDHPETSVPPAPAQVTQPTADGTETNESVTENCTSADHRQSTSSASESFVDASDALHVDATANGTDTLSSGAHGAPPGLGQGTLTSSSEVENTAETVQEVSQVPETTAAGDSNTGTSIMMVGGANTGSGEEEAVQKVGGAEKGRKDKAGETVVVPVGQEEHEREATREEQESQDDLGRKPAQNVEGSDATKAPDVTTNPSDFVSSNVRQSALTAAVDAQITSRNGATAAPPASHEETAPLTDTSKVLSASGQNKPKTPPSGNDGEHDFALVSLEEGNEDSNDRNAVGGDGSPRDTDEWQHVQRPGSRRPETRIVVPQRAVSASPVQQRQTQMQMRRAPSETRPSSAGGLQPQRVAALQPPAMQRSASPGAIHSPRPTQTGGFLSSVATIAPVITEFISGSGPATPVTPGEDGDAEDGFVELDEETVNGMAREEKEKYRKRLKKKRQAQNKKNKKNEASGIFGAWFAS